MTFKEPNFITGFIALAAYETWKMYERDAPTIAEVKSAPAGDIEVRTAIQDADISVGTMTLIIGGTMSILTRDLWITVMLLAVVAALSIRRRLALK